MADEPLNPVDALLAHLAKAQSPAELRELHARLGTAIRRTRRRVDNELGPLANTYVEAMRIWDAEKTDGVAVEARQQHLEQTLRAAWPQTRVWKYLCERCSDTGWEPGTCTPETPCGRPFRLPGQRSDDFTGQGQCAPGHAFVQPCVCVKGDARRRQLEPPAPTSGDFQQAGKKGKGMTRFGR